MSRDMTIFHCQNPECGQIVTVPEGAQAATRLCPNCLAATRPLPEGDYIASEFFELVRALHNRLLYATATLAGGSDREAQQRHLDRLIKRCGKAILDVQGNRRVGTPVACADFRRMHAAVLRLCLETLDRECETEG